MKAEEMTIAEYNELVMRDAFEMLLKADGKIGEAEAALKMSRLTIADAGEKMLSAKKVKK